MVEIYQVARTAAQLIATTFFDEIRTIGAERIPLYGPVIFVGNHNNKFVDASVMMQCIPRTLRFLIATVSLSVPLVGRLAKLAGAIGVNRPQDMRYTGMGRITAVYVLPLEGENENADNSGNEKMSLLMEGVDTAADLSGRVIITGDSRTRFPLDLKPGHRVKLLCPCDGCSATVEKVLSNDRLLAVWNSGSGRFPNCRVKSGDETPSARASEAVAMAESRGVAFSVFPKVDQGEVYESVSRALYEGHSICIFPEGGSHDQPGLLPLKSGVAVMALNAALVGVEDVLIIPVGIHYFNRDKFGSKAVVEFGEPLALSQDLIETYAHGDRKRAVSVLMNDVRSVLRNCMVTASSYEMLRAIELCAELFPPDTRNLHVDAERKHKLQTLFTQLFQLLDKVPETVGLLEEINAYQHLLESNGLEDHDVVHMSQTAESAFWWMAVLVPKLLLVLLVSIPAMTVTAPIRSILRVMTERHRQAQLNASSVKISGADVVASYKIIWFIAAMPVICVAFSIILSFVLGYRSVGSISAIACANLLILPYIAYHSLRIQQNIVPLAKKVRCCYRVIMSEWDLWRGSEREIVTRRIHAQLAVRGYIAHIIDKRFLEKLSEDCAASDSANSGSPSNRVVEGETAPELVSGNFNERRIKALRSDIERIVPRVILDADNRRLLRARERFAPLVYRASVLSREEIL